MHEQVGTNTCNDPPMPTKPLAGQGPQKHIVTKPGPIQQEGAARAQERPENQYEREAAADDNYEELNQAEQTCSNRRANSEIRVMSCDVFKECATSEYP